MVGIDCCSKAKISHIAQRVMLLTGNRSALEVARWADFERGTAFPRQLYNRAVLDNADSVPDALCPHLQDRIPNVARSRPFTGMYCDAQPGFLSRFAQCKKWCTGIAIFRPGEVDPDHAIVAMFQRCLKGTFPLFDTLVTVHRHN